jgi:hypothetical protein
MIELAAGIALGVAASGHCVVMCGPLMLAVRHASPWHGLGNRRHAVPLGLYHAGRVAGYAVLGLAVSVTGAMVAGTAELGRVLSLVASACLVLMAAGHAGLRLPDPLGARAGRLVGSGLRTIHPYLSSHPWLTAAASGGITALLPCGLLYAALLASATFANPLHAAAFMVAYGAGTLPLLGVLAWSANRIPNIFRARLRPLTPAVLLALAALLVLRAVGPSALIASTAHAH